MSSQPRPVACTLSAKGARDQAREWTDLHGHALSVEPAPGGARISNPAEFDSLLADLTRREASCCAFLDITTSIDDNRVIVEVTSTNPDALPVISLLAGVQLPEQG